MGTATRNKRHALARKAQLNLIMADMLANKQATKQTTPTMSMRSLVLNQSINHDLIKESINRQSTNQLLTDSLNQPIKYSFDECVRSFVN